ncbi:hypothetical protein I6A83_12315 [Enterococcus faecalis]|uniref:hypothetical protein n=1 Tax=Enterococcus faecalis TaxID=1351 RepID=UPI0019670BDF|nr:hypothetical protein [Enterococcus faecalis]MBN3024421.1 hypothetical protein [Enterococcus faecalis]MBO6313217.1 hypothetical protein [Enterococcus faecalis]
MKSITQLLIMGAFGLALGIGGTFVYAKNVLLPQQTKTIQNYVKKTNDLEQELKAFKEDKEGASTKEISIPKHSYSHQEYVNLKSIGEQFSKSYYDITTDTAEEKLKGLSKILTPKLSGKLRPAWVDDYKNSIRIEQETISEQYYVKLNGVTGKATMIGCLIVSTKHGNAQAFDVKYIDKFNLEKDEKNHWKIKKFEEQIAPREFSESYFTQE